MSNCYNLSNQKLLHEINVLEHNIDILKCRALTSPCISIKGFDKLQIHPIKYNSTESPVHDVIHKLFMLLNIPNFWIHSIENPHNHIKPNNLPSTVNIYLITDNIKMHVYNTLLKYLRYTDQKSVTVKLIIK
jgi:hypothetical protein